MKRFLSMLLVLVMVLGCLSACDTENPGTSESPDASTPGSTTSLIEEMGGVLRYGLTGEPTGLFQPNTTFSLVNGVAGLALFDTLIHYNSDTGELEPMMAKSWEQPDASTIIVHLRDDIYSAAGTHFTASDVIYNLRVGVANKALNTYYQCFDAENSYAEGDYTAVIKLKYDYATAPTLLAYSCFAMACEADVEAAGGPDAFNTNPVAIGMYKFVSWESGQKITLARNDSYYGEKAPFDTVEIYFIPDTSARVLAMQSGDIDMTISLSTSDMELLEAEPGIDVVLAESGANNCLWFNYLHPILSDVRVRQALSYAIDRNAVLQMAFGGVGSTSDSIFGNTDSVYAPAPTEELAYNQNIEKAKELLAEAGYPDGFDISVNILQYQYLLDEAAVLQNCFAQIGVNLTINPMDTGSFFAAMYSGQFDMFAITNSGIEYCSKVTFFDPNNAPATGNLISYNNMEMATLLAKVKGTVDDAARAEVFAEIQNLLREDCAIMPLVASPAVQAIRSGLNVRWEPMGSLLINSVSAK